MQEVELPLAYLFKGNTYGPGKARVPDDLHARLVEIEVISKPRRKKPEPKTEK